MAMASTDTAADDGSIPQEDPPPLGNRITTAVDDHGQLNLVSLPDDVLELLFKMLPVRDRGRLACTCSRLSDVVHWPSVWRDVTIRLSIDRTGLSRASSISEMDKAVIRKYSKFFRHVEIMIPSELIHRESFDLLTDLSEKQVIKNVVWTADTPFDISHALAWPERRTVDDFEKTLPDLTKLLEHSAQISVTLNSFDVSIMERYPTTVLEKFSRLTWNILLTRRYGSAHDVLILLLLGSPLSADVLSIFPALQVLEMNMANLSDQLLLELSDSLGRRCQLKRLIIGDSSQITFGYPQVSSAAWSRLTAASPSLQVECSVRAEGFAKVSSAIKPETPLVKLEAVFNAEVNIDSILALCELCKQHSRSLQYFALSGATSLRSQQAIEGMRSMLLACPNLYLSCNDDVDEQIIQDLSTDCRHWRRFHFTHSDHT